MNNFKAIQVCLRFYPDVGGIETYVQEISKRLIQKGWDIEVYTTDPSGKLPEEDVIDGVKVKRFKSFAPNETIFFSYSLFDALKKANADIIHAHGYRALPVFLAALAKKYNKSKFVVTTHLGFSKIGRWVYHLYNPTCGDFIFRSADKIMVVSPAEMEEISTIKKYAFKTSHVPNGVDFTKIDKIKSSRNSPKKDNFLYVGRLEKKKGVHLAIEILGELKKLGLHDLKLTVVGDGPYLNELRRLPKLYGVENDVKFLGRLPQDEIYDLYMSHKYLILLSDYEAHSMTLTEALAFGLVPIVTNVGGNKYLIKNGENGYLIEKDKVVTESVRVITSLRQKKINEIGENNIELVRKKFTLESTVDRIEEEYLNLMKM